MMTTPEKLRLLASQDIGPITAALLRQAAAEIDALELLLRDTRAASVAQRAEIDALLRATDSLV